MALPTLIQLAKGQAKFVRYQDGKLWYRIVWFEDTGPEHFESRNFDFPIPVDMPEIYEVLLDVASTLKMEYKITDGPARMIAQAVEYTLKDAEEAGAGGGEFLPEDKGIRFMRWIRKHLDFLKESAKVP